jgi:hypothetical protein
MKEVWNDSVVPGRGVQRSPKIRGHGEERQNQTLTIRRAIIANGIATAAKSNISNSIVIILNLAEIAGTSHEEQHARMPGLAAVMAITGWTIGASAELTGKPPRDVLGPLPGLPPDPRSEESSSPASCQLQ